MHGIINLNKPKGITSRQAATKVQRLFGARKSGHAGTLDPSATGVLLICLNEATKISRFLLGLDKQYHATLKLGERTDTYDAEGKVIEVRKVPDLAEAEISAVARQFTGRIQQRPPMYSAVKISGSPLYRLARKGLEVERPERTVEVYGLEVMQVMLPFVDIKVSCSKGTYIRSLCDDMGQALGTGAHLISLNRTRVGAFDVSCAVTFDDLISAKDQHRLSSVVSGMNEALSEMPAVELDEEDHRKARHGMEIVTALDELPLRAFFVRLKGPDGNLFGIGRVNHGRISIERILNL